MSRDLRRTFSRYGAAVLLLVLLPAELASPAFLAQEHHRECRHDSCPMRAPAKAAQTQLPCHGAGHHGSGGHHAAQPEPAPRTSCSLRASCGCGHSHETAAFHQAPRAVLEPVLTAFAPLPSGFLLLVDGPGRSDLLPDPESPPPRFSVPA